MKVRMYEVEVLEVLYYVWPIKKDFTLQQNFLLYKGNAYKQSDIQAR